MIGINYQFDKAYGARLWCLLSSAPEASVNLHKRTRPDADADKKRPRAASLMSALTIEMEPQHLQLTSSTVGASRSPGIVPRSGPKLAPHCGMADRGSRGWFERDRCNPPRSGDEQPVRPAPYAYRRPSTPLKLFSKQNS